MLEKLDFIEKKYKELTDRMMDPELINDLPEWQRVMKEHADIEPIVMKYREYTGIVEELEGAKEMLYEKLEDDMREMVKEEIKDLEESLISAEEELKILLIPKDPNDHKMLL